MNLEDIKINVAYNQILAYDEHGNAAAVNSNLADYDIHPWHTAQPKELESIATRLNVEWPVVWTNQTPAELSRELVAYTGQQLESLFDNAYNTFKAWTLEDILKTDESFIYPYITYNNELYFKYPTVEIDERIIQKCHEGKCKIVFGQFTEGFLGEDFENYNWFTHLADRYGLTKDNLLMVTANLKAPEYKDEYVRGGRIKDNFTIVPYPYFGCSLWFTNYGKLLGEYNKEQVRNMFNEFYVKNQVEKKKYHFLSFNRVPKIHRMLIFGELQTNPNFADKYITSMGTYPNDDNPLAFFNNVRGGLRDNYKHGSQRLYDFFQNYDSTKPTVYDESNMHDNHASNLNSVAHQGSFVNIVTESLINPEAIFFSEKIYKPIFCAQPFILFGNAGSLRKLKELGFRTFDQWWDESYDYEDDITSKLEKIVDVMLEISTWDTDKMFQVTQEMKEVFQHNIDRLLSNEDFLKAYLKLAE